MGLRTIKDKFDLYFQSFSKIACVAKQQGQFWENFENTGEIKP